MNLVTILFDEVHRSGVEKGLSHISIRKTREEAFRPRRNPEGRRIHKPPAFDAAGILVGGSTLTRSGVADKMESPITMISAHQI